jgi:hypothetical protein
MTHWILRWFHRVDQFRRAVFARVFEREIEEISSILAPEEFSQFCEMSIVDQRHSLDVYYTALKLLSDFPEADPSLTKRAVLLHDLGKSRFCLSLFDRILATLPRPFVRGFFPSKAAHVFAYRDLHPGLSAEMVLDERLKPWVKVHYEKVNEEDPPELKILKIADRMN